MSRLNRYINEGKGLSNSDLPTIADHMIRYFIGDTESGANQLKKVKNKGFDVNMDHVNSGEYVKLFNKYHKQLTALLKSMKKDFEG